MARDDAERKKKPYTALTTLKNPGLNTPEAGAPAGPSSLRSLRDSIHVAKTAGRFEVSRDDVRQAIEQIEAERQAAPTIEVTAERRGSELLEYLRAEYDRCARVWGFADMIHMMAVAHTEMVARAIHDPASFGREGLRALKDLAPMLYPAERVTAKRTLPAGETKVAVLERMFKRLHQVGELPATTGSASPSNEDPPLLEE